MTREEREQINLELLVDLTRQKSDSAFEMLSDYYYPVITALYQEVTNGHSFISRDEAMQAGKIGLYNAVCYYRDDRNMNFNNFAKLCIRREINAWQRKEIRFSYIDDRQIVSLDRIVQDGDEISYMETVESKLPGPDLRVRENELVQDIFTRVGNDSIEGKILKYRMEGYSYQEISDFLEVNKKFVDNSLRKSRKKIVSLFD